VPVFLSFKVMMATSGTQDDCRWSANGVGMRFTMDPYVQNNNFPLPNAAAIHLTAAPLDTVAWTTVSGVYIPDSAYRHVVLGGLFSDSLVTAVQFNPTGNINRAFAFIDDICVSYLSSECGVETGLVEHSRAWLHAFPNPFTTNILVSVGGLGQVGMDVWMQDLLGRSIWSGRVQQGQGSFTIDGSRLPEGPYVISGRTPTELLPATTVIRVSP